MSLWSRIVNVVRGERLNREIDEEFASHIEEAVADGRDPAEARRAFGPALRQREESRDARIVAWLDSLRADTVFGLRQIWKRKVTSAAAILSLGLAIGACTTAFRLIDALLLRPLPIAAPERLYALFRQGVGFYDGKPFQSESFEYPPFVRMRAAVKDRAELLAISYADRWDITWSTDEETEKAFLQYVSGDMFRSFGLKPALGRLLTAGDDLKPGAHPVAVLSYDYWARRFGSDPKIVGRRFRIAGRYYEVIGVAERAFTGTEPGTVTSIFLPTMMNDGVVDGGRSWLQTFVMLRPGVSPEPVQERLRTVFQASQEDRVKEFRGRPAQFIDRFLRQTVLLEPAAAGISGMQKDYRISLIALAVLVGLVLLIACANVANLMTAQAAARAREMALRVSIGAGRWRLVQLILIESAWMACLAAVVGGAFAWRAAPFVVGMINPPDNPARLYLPADWRVLGFAVLLMTAVILLFGLAPALRASGVRPSSALRGGEDARSRRRLMPALIALQVAFCFVVQLAGGLFIATFNKLSNQPTGFSADRLLTVVTAANPPRSPVFWEQAAERLRAEPGVEAAAVAGFALLSGNGWNGFVSIGGAPPDSDETYFLGVSPGWVDAMKIPFFSGGDFRPGDSDPGVAIVNAAFAKRHFGGQNASGKWFDKVIAGGVRRSYRIVGVVGDARYRDMREPIVPTVYVPFRSRQANGALSVSGGGTFIVRTSGSDPLSLAPMLRRELARAGFRVSAIRTQQELILGHTVRERLLAMLATFFAGVALLLAGIGLYGVLSYSVLQRRREIGIRMAIGARARNVAWRVTGDVLAMVLAGAAAGLVLGMACARYIESLLFEVKATDLSMLILPVLTIVAAALLAALPAVIRALRIDPAKMLRAE